MTSGSSTSTLHAAATVMTWRPSGGGIDQSEHSIILINQSQVGGVAGGRGQGGGRQLPGGVHVVQTAGHHWIPLTEALHPAAGDSQVPGQVTTNQNTPSILEHSALIRKEEEEILNFVVNFLPDRMVDLWEGNLNKWSQSDRY